MNVPSISTNVPPGLLGPAQTNITSNTASAQAQRALNLAESNVQTNSSTNTAYSTLGNGDVIAYSKDPKTSQGTVKAYLHDGDVANAFSNGKNTVQDANGDTLIDRNGELYGQKAGSSQQVDLGSDKASSSGWQTAISDGFATSSSEKELQEVNYGGIGQIAELKQQFAFTSTGSLHQHQSTDAHSAINELINLLSNSA